MSAEQEIRDDERQRCAELLRAWADEALADMIAGTPGLAGAPEILRMASFRLRDGAKSFSPSHPS